MPIPKRFHVYQGKVRTEPYVDPKRNFYVLSTAYAYGGGCGGEGAGIETYPHMFDALDFQLGWLLEFDESHFGPEDFREQRENLEASIQQIIDEGTDEGTNPSFLSIDGSRVGYSTLAAGYWDQFVYAALSVFAWELDDRISEAEQDDEEDVGDWAEELARVKSLEKQENTQTPSFVKEFMALASAYEERHC